MNDFYQRFVTCSTESEGADFYKSNVGAKKKQQRSVPNITAGQHTPMKGTSMKGTPMTNKAFITGY